MKNQYTIVILPGDGIGPEVIKQAVNLLEIINHHLGTNFSLINIPCGGKYYLEHGMEWPKTAFEKCQAADAILLGAVGYEVNGKTIMTEPNKPYPQSQLAGYAAVIGNRQKLNLYANVRPVQLFAGIKHKISNKFKLVWKPKNVDYVIVRENTEDAYTGEFTRHPNEVITPIKISLEATEKVVRFAYRLTKKRNKYLKLTCADKSNIIESHKYFREIFTEIGKKEFPEIKRDYAYADAFCQWQIQQPELYDVVVAPNLIGDIISDNGAVSQGGLGMAAGGNIGDEHAMFEPIHGSAPTLAGLNRANPIAAILASRMMLEWLGDKNQDRRLNFAADCIEHAVKKVIRKKILTADLIEAPHSTTCDKVGDSIASHLEQFLQKNRKGVFQ